MIQNKILNLGCKFMIILSLFAFSTANATANIEDWRVKLNDARVSQQKADELYDELMNVETDDALLTAFKASASGIMCLHYTSPNKRLKYLKQASEFADKAVEMDRNHLEVRFIRFAIESQAPKFLGYSKNLNADKEFLIKQFKQENFGSIPFTTLEEMVHVMEESGKFSKSTILSFKAELHA